MMATPTRIGVKDASSGIHRRGTNARLREQTMTAHRAEVRGQILNKASSLGLRIGLGSLAVVALGLGSWFGWQSFSASHWVSLRDFEVRGMVKVPAARVAELSGLFASRPLAKLDLEAARTRLESEPWIATARVTRRWPRRVRIEIVERRAVARVGTGGWVSADGVALSRRGAEVYPLLVGPGYKGGRIPVLRARESLASLEQMERAGWMNAIEQVALASDGSMQLRIAGLAPRVLLGPQEWKRSLARVGALRLELGDQIALFSEIDLRHGACASLRRADGGL